jgi:predicted small secreted protein
MKWCKSVFCFLLLALVFVGLVGCNTVKGVGKDVEKTGEAIQGK